MNLKDTTTFRVGSRKSELALFQTNYVIEKLKETYSDRYNFVVTKLDTIGDKVLDKSLPKIGEKSLFTKELEEALDRGEIDLVVHSLKDLPTCLPDGKVIGVVLKRENPYDCVILNKKYEPGQRLDTLPEGSVIGTSSLRRAAQIKNKYPHLKVENIRGNLNTRLRKLDEDGMYDGIILAVAGVKRMNWTARISQIWDSDDGMYAVGQGALAVECTSTDNTVLSLLSPLIDHETTVCVIAERSFLKTLEGGCSAPVAVNCQCMNNMKKLVIVGMVCDLEGKEVIKETMEKQFNHSESNSEEKHADTNLTKISHIKTRSYCGIISNSDFFNWSCKFQMAEELGKDLATLLITKGALKIMERARKCVKI